MRRNGPRTLATKLRDAGLKLLPSLLEDFSVGGVDDLLQKIHDTAKLVESGSDAIEKELEQTYENVLAKKLAAPEGMALIKAKIAAIEKATAAPCALPGSGRYGSRSCGSVQVVSPARNSTPAPGPCRNRPGPVFQGLPDWPRAFREPLVHTVSALAGKADPNEDANLLHVRLGAAVGHRGDHPDLGLPAGCRRPVADARPAPPGTTRQAAQPVLPAEDRGLCAPTGALVLRGHAKLDALERMGVDVERVNIDQHPDLAAQNSITSIPVYFVIRCGHETVRTQDIDEAVRLMNEVFGR